jgi:hypothetical protein
MGTYSKQYYELHKEKYKLAQKKYREKNKHQLKKYWREYRYKNKEKLKIYEKQYREKNIDLEKLNKICLNCQRPFKAKRITAKYCSIKCSNNYFRKIKPNYHKQYKQEYLQKNKPWLNLCLDDRIKRSLRTRFYKSITKKAKYNSINKLIGCSITELRQHLEKQFTNGMTWDNYGEWHIDHIKPCSKFNLKLIEDQRECFNYNNLQPLWAKDNLTKYNKIVQCSPVHRILYNTL